MNKVFQNTKIRVLFLIYIITLIIPIVISEIPVVKDTKVMDLNVCLFIGYSLVLLWFIVRMLRAKVDFVKEWQQFRMKFNWRELISVLVTNIVLTLGTAMLLVSVVFGFNREWAEALLKETDTATATTLIAIAAMTLLTVILAPLVEEAMFRGVIMSRFKKRWGFTAAAVISSILFGIGHFQLSIISAFAFGLVMCVLYQKTGSIITDMSVHFVNNLLCTAATLAIGSDGSADGAGATEMITQTDAYVYLVIGLILTAVSAYFTIRYLVKNWPHKDERHDNGSDTDIEGSFAA